MLFRDGIQQEIGDCSAQSFEIGTHAGPGAFGQSRVAGLG